MSAGGAASFVNERRQRGARARCGARSLPRAGARLPRHLFDTLTARWRRMRATAARARQRRGREPLDARRAPRRRARATRAFGGRARRPAQVQDAYALVEHVAPHTRSEADFPRHRRRARAGGLQRQDRGRARARTARDSRQSLRGLLAGPEAEIDVRPQLEIHTDDVRCSHGATAGKLERTCCSICCRADSTATARSAC